jgi:hypothetical protein
MTLTSSPRAAASRPQATKVAIPVCGHDGAPVDDDDLRALEAPKFDPLPAKSSNLSAADGEDLRASNLDAPPELEGRFDRMMRNGSRCHTGDGVFRERESAQDGTRHSSDRRHRSPPFG